MKSTLTVTVSVLFFALLILGLSLPAFHQPSVLAQGPVSLQTTATPQAADGTSVIGSTDGILVMGIVIVLIVTLPLLFRKKSL
ncbi:MAG: hypothetical protein IPO22_04790 [Anaerolineales bacterium]|jgi:hypothetical protein|nr:hypothetical protein [Anaerolineales bacterium]